MSSSELNDAPQKIARVAVLITKQSPSSIQDLRAGLPNAMIYESITCEGMDMKPNRFTEVQINGILREQEAGAKTAEVCRKHGVSSATFYKWKAKYGGLDVSDAKCLRSLEDERRVNQLFH